MTALKNLFESKAFVQAILAAAAAAGAVYGFNVPVATIMMILTPIMVAIGAQGWSDAVKMKAKMALEHEVRMQALANGHMTYADAANGNLPAERMKQAGFARLSMLAGIATLAGALALGTLTTTTSCKNPSPIVTDVIDCAKAEAQAVANGYSIIQIVNTVIGVFTGKPLPGCEQAQNVLECDAEQLVLKFGSDMVACVLDSIPTPTPAPAPTPGPGSGSAAPPLPQGSLLAERKAMLLQKVAPGKKIVHSYKKGGN